MSNNKMTKKQKLRYIAALTIWAVISVGIYVAAMTSGNITAVSAVTTAYIAVVALCAVAYTIIYCRIISLRKKAGVSPEQPFDPESCADLDEGERAFLKKAKGYIKALMVIAVPVLFIIMIDVVITMLL